MLETLSLGPKNAVLNQFEPNDVLTQLDLFINRCDKKAFQTNSKIVDINVKTLDYIKKCKKLKCSKHINMTKKYLKDNELLAVPFDKGIGICLMKRETYNDKTNDILKLNQLKKVQKKRKNEKHPVIKEEERILLFLKDLKEKGEIGDVLFNKMKPIGSQPPRLYGLAKVHKANTPVRPVLSMPGSAYYGIAKQVAFWLSHVPECNINSSTKIVCDSLNATHLADNETLVSFDVSSLYTNVPVMEAIQVSADLMYNPKNSKPPVSKETFIELAKIASCNVIMSTHDGLYEQTDGLAMGSPPAPHLANAWMSQFDSTIKGNSSIYTRYMDDILCEKPIEEVDNTLTRINNLHSNLKFTIERPCDGAIPFLDMKIINENGNLSSTWYSKPTDTGLIMNFHSLAPRRYKHSVVSGFVHRIHRACSTWHHFHESLDRAKNILKINQYPSYFYEPIIFRTLESIINPDSVQQKTKDQLDDIKNNFKLFVQYRGKSTEHYAHALHKLEVPCTVVMTLRKAKTVLPSLKPPVEKELRSGVVYKIECPRCQACYVGQTVRHLKTRISEHGYRGPVKEHFIMCGVSDIDLKYIDILASTNQGENYLLTLEALQIKELKPSINTKDEFKSRALRIRI